MLLRGITLNILSERFEPSDVRISSGTRPLGGADASPAAVTARDDWRPLDELETQRLHAGDTKEDVPLKDQLTVFELDAGVLDAHREELFPLLASANGEQAGEELAARRSAAVQRVRESLLDVLARRAGVVCADQGPADAVVHAPGRASTAFNYDARVFMGLHLDNHQDHALTERHLAYPLACVNLGFRDRFVQFVNLRTLDVLAMLGAAGLEAPGTTHALKNLFFATFGSYPVLRIRLRPGQAYLVNTQDVLHDGATNDDGVPDVSLLTANDLVRADR